MKKTTVILILILAGVSGYAQKSKFSREVLQYNYEGNLRMSQKKYEQAIASFSKVLEKDPEAFFAYRNRAMCYLELKDSTNALADFMRNVKLEPDNIQSYYNIGMIFRQRKDSVQAVNYYRKVIQSAKSDFDTSAYKNVHSFCGNYYRAKQKYDSAVFYYNLLLLRFPGSTYNYINRAVCYFYLDSIPQFCEDIKIAALNGGKIPCEIFMKFCPECPEGIKKTTIKNSNIIYDSRLTDIYAKANNNPEVRKDSILHDNSGSHKVKVYFNKYWEITLNDNAAYYRISNWNKSLNFFSGNFTDYYISGEKYAEGRILYNNLTGEFTRYYKNGVKMQQCNFSNGYPTGIMTFYLPSGEIDFTIVFLMDEFKINIVNKNNPNLSINSGTGSFSIILDKIEDIEFTLDGKFTENQKDGIWTLKRKNEIVFTDKYKKGNFKSGTYCTPTKTFLTEKPFINSNLFAPVYLTQVRSLIFESVQIVNEYPFITVKIW